MVGAPIANRSLGELENLIGFFVNSLVLRTDLSANPSFRELLRRVQKTALSAYANQDFPFEKLVEEMHSSRETSRSPLFQVMFALQNIPKRTLDLPGLTATRFFPDDRRAKFDLTLFMYEEPEYLHGRMEFNTDLFDGSTIQRMVGHFQTILQGDRDRPGSLHRLLCHCCPRPKATRSSSVLTRLALPIPALPCTRSLKKTSKGCRKR